jgi:hypothetical protein
MGAHSAMPVYPAAMSTLAQPMMPPGRWHAAKVTAGVLCFVAVVLVVASSFLPLYSGELSLGSQSIEVTITPWHAEYSPDAASDAVGDVPKVGYPMVFAAVFLACAAAACWYAGTPTARQTASRAAGVTTSIAGAFLIGTAWTTALLVSNGVDYVILLGTLNDGLETDATYLVGYWLLLTASLLAFTAAILSLVPSRQPAWQQPLMPAYPHVPTPSYGMAPPMDALPRPAGQMNTLTRQPTHIDPMTGQPVPFPPAAPAGVAPVAGYPMVHGPASPAAGTPLAPAAVDPLTGQPVSPPGGLPFQQNPASGLDPLTGQPVSPAGGLPFQQNPASGLDPLTGQPVSPAGGLPFQQNAAGGVDPLTGQPVSQGPTTGGPFAQGVVVDPMTGLPLAPGTPVPTAQPAPFTPEPVGQVNGAPAAPVVEPGAEFAPGAGPEPVPAAGPAPVAEPAPIVVPDAPPLPENPPGPAIPSTEDPLAEPPRT